MQFPFLSVNKFREMAFLILILNSNIDPVGISLRSLALEN